MHAYAWPRSSGLPGRRLRQSASPHAQPCRNWKPGGYLKSVPRDPWQNPYQYLSPGVKGEIDVFSLGSDNKPGGDGAASDVGNWAKTP